MFRGHEGCGKDVGGNWEGALKRLAKAEKLCRAALAEEELGEEEIAEEVAVLRAQAAFAHQMAGRGEVASGIYGEILAGKPGDPVVAAVVATNLVALRSPLPLPAYGREVVPLECYVVLFQRRGVEHGSVGK